VAVNDADDKMVRALKMRQNTSDSQTCGHHDVQRVLICLSVMLLRQRGSLECCYFMGGGG
jgi:hypothetical protein